MHKNNLEVLRPSFPQNMLGKVRRKGSEGRESGEGVLFLCSFLYFLSPLREVFQSYSSNHAFLFISYNLVNTIWQVFLWKGLGLSPLHWALFRGAFVFAVTPPPASLSTSSLMSALWHCGNDLFVLTTQDWTQEVYSLSILLAAGASTSSMGLISVLGCPCRDSPTGPDSCLWGCSFIVSENRHIWASLSRIS